MGVWTTFPLYTYLPTAHVYVNQKKGVKHNYCRGLTKGFYHCAAFLVLVALGTTRKSFSKVAQNADHGHIHFLRILYHIPYHGQKSDINILSISRQKIGKGYISYILSNFILASKTRNLYYQFLF
jgi:hypothetical protein